MSMRHATTTHGSISAMSISNGRNVMTAVISVGTVFGTTTVGIAYKPEVHVGRNNAGRLRIGVLGGSDTNKFVGGGTVGYEHTYQLRGGIQLFWNVRTDVMARGEDLFKTGVSIGARVNL